MTDMHKMVLKCPQEVEDVLLIRCRQGVEVRYYRISLGTRAGMVQNRLMDVRRASIMQEEDTLADAPKRRGSEILRTRRSARDSVPQPHAHIVNGVITPRRVLHVALFGHRRVACRLEPDVARNAPHRDELGSPISDRGRIGDRRRWC